MFFILNFLKIIFENPFIETKGKRSIKKILKRPVNAQKIGTYPKYDDWPKEDKLKVKRMAPLAEMYGFKL